MLSYQQGYLANKRGHASSEPGQPALTASAQPVPTASASIKMQVDAPIEMQAYAPINKVIPFSLVDGPGARVSVFVQGCNIHCAYCHNPETQNLCLSCGDCVAGCPIGALSVVDGRVCWDSQACVSCDACIKTCMRYASPRVMWRTAEDVFEQVAGYRPFIRGVTCSGGECMLYPDFLAELFERCRQVGLSCLIDSNGTIDFVDHEGLLELADGVMLDVKAWDDEWFVHLTGTDGKTVRKNLALLAEREKLQEVRVIVTEGWNDPEAAVDGIVQTLGQRVSATHLRLMKFRPFGVTGSMANSPSPSDERMDALERQAYDAGFGTVVVS